MSTPASVSNATSAEWTKTAMWDVAIVGYGPSGVALAHLLGQRGVRVLVVERDTDVFPRQRALSVDDEALRVMRAMGHYDEVTSTMHRGATIHFTGLNSKPFLTLLPLPTEGCLESQANFIHQPHMEGVLREGISQMPNVALAAGSEFVSLTQNADEVSLTVRTPEGADHVVHARYAVGCDGGSSPVRKALGIPFAGHSYDEKWIDVQGVYTGPPSSDPHFKFFCDPERPGVDTPTAGGTHRWEWRVNEGEDAAELLKPESIAALLAKRGVDIADVDIKRSWEYTFHVRRAARWREGRVFLAGDAAHIMPPFAGQGVSGAFRDAANLAWKLHATLTGRAGVSLLDSYEDERGPHVEAVSKMAIRIGKVVMPPNRFVAWVRDWSLRLVSSLPGMRERMSVAMLRPLPIQGGFLDQRGAAKRTPTGNLLPQVRLIGSDGVTRTVDEHIGDHFAIITMGADPGTVAPENARKAWEQTFAPRFLHVKPGTSKVEGTALGDPVGMLWDWFKHHDIDTVIVRPDRYVYWAGRAVDLPVPLPTGAADQVAVSAD